MDLKSNERAWELIYTLCNGGNRMMGVGHNSTQGRWAAIRLMNDFDEKSVFYLAQGILFWSSINTFDQEELKRLGLRNAEIAVRLINTALDNATHIIRYFFYGDRCASEQKQETNLIYLLNCLKSSNENEILVSLKAFEYIHDYRCLEDAIYLLESKNKKIRKAAIKVLKSNTRKNFIFRNRKPKVWKKYLDKITKE